MKVFKKYHYTQLVNLLWSSIATKIFFRKSRLIRLPIDIRNKRFISFGKELVTGRYNRIECYPLLENTIPNLTIGDNVQINDRCHFTCVEELIIGNNCLIASNVFITDHDHANMKLPIDFKKPWAEQPVFSKKVRIENNVWIGENVVILKGVTVGNNSVIAAGSIVTRSFPENSIIAGNPARLIRKL